MQTFNCTKCGSHTLLEGMTGIKFIREVEEIDVWGDNNNLDISCDSDWEIEDVDGESKTEYYCGVCKHPVSKDELRAIAEDM